MERSRDEILRLLAVVEEHGRAGTGACANCGRNHWVPMADLVELRGVDQTFPCLALACKTCGFVRLHSEEALKTHFGQEG